MLIEAWVAALLFVFIGAIGLLATANSMCLEDKLDESNKEIARLQEEIGDYRVAIEKFRHEEIIRLANEYFNEGEKK